MSDTYDTFNYASFRELPPKKRGEAIAGILSSFVNGTHNESSEAFVEAITSDHRTLQQMTFGLFLQLVDKWAEIGDDKEFCRFDARNEFTVETALKIRNMFEKEFGTGTIKAPLI
jgi:hypothetical protein